MVEHEVVAVWVGEERHVVVSPQEWKGALDELLVKEKSLTRARDALAAERRRMPWLAVEKKYRLEGPDGAVGLLEPVRGAPAARRLPRLLRAGGHHLCRGRLLPGARVRGLLVRRRPGGSSGAPERAGHDARVRLTRASARDPGPQGAERMAFSVVHDHGRLRPRLRRRRVARDERLHPHGKSIYRTYFVHSRGDEHMGSTWSYLDITALGRQEEWEETPEDRPQTPPYQWWNYHDAYGAGA